MDEEGPLTDDEAALVFRRATELDVELARHRDGWDLPQLEAVGREVGISAEAVRGAVAEVRLGAPSVDLPRVVARSTRIVPAPAAAAQAQLSSWLREQLFDAVRERPGLAVFDQRHDVDADRRRQRDHARRYRLGAVERVVLTAAGVPGGGSAVRVEAVLRTTRRRRAVVRTAAVVSAVWVGAAVVGGASGVVGIEQVWLVTPGIAAGAAWWSWRSAGVAEHLAAAEVELTIDGALDRLEAQL